MESAAYFSAIKTQQRIDSEKGIIYGCSVITIGQAAGKNAGTWIDRITLSQIDSVAKTYPDGIKVKLSETREHDGSAGQIAGVLKNFRIEGNQERADLHLLRSAEKFNLILEMAATMPSEFGLSVVIPKELEEIDGKACLRCSEIYSIDLVEAPAANPTGLFSADGHGGHLVEKDGQKHLPTSKDGKFDPHLAGAAWAALHGGYRGNKYEGPDKEAAIAKLKRLYKEHGMKTPDEKESMSKIKFKEGESGPHAEDCECKECMAKHSKKEMTAMLARITGLDPEKATETEIQAAFKASSGDMAAVAELSKKLTEAEAKLSRIESTSANALALSQKGEIETMLAEASRSGKVVPFDNDDLFTEKDGQVTIKMQPTALAKVISKLSAGTARTTRTVTLTAKTADGKEQAINRRTPEGAYQFSQMLAAKRQESADRYMATRHN